MTDWDHRMTTLNSETMTRAAIVRKLDKSLDAAYGGTFTEMLWEIALQIRLLIGAHQSTVSYIPDGDFAEAIHTHSFSEQGEAYSGSEVKPSGDGILGCVAGQQKVMRLTHEELTAHPRWPSSVDLGDLRDQDHPPMRGWLAVPVSRLNGEFVGVLQLTDKFEGAEFSAEDESSLIRFARVAGLAFDLYYVNSELGLEVKERRSVAAQLRQAHKMESIGKLAGGVAHDFNNMLTAIRGYSDLMLEDLHREDPMYEDACEIVKVCDRAASLTHQLLAFSRKQILQPKAVDLNLVVERMRNILHRVIGEDIELDVQLGCWEGSIKVDPCQLEQVILNLCINARSAMPTGGTLTIVTAGLQLDERYCARHTYVAPGPYVMLAVSDTGTGIDPALIPRIFEPFFTTKAVNKGTGLGLSMVYGIVKQSGGSIEVASAPGEGASFQIFLPRVEEAAGSQEQEIPDEALGGTETILLVEDDQMLRAMISRVLRRRGYIVLEAENGGEALMTSTQYTGTVDLLLTDLVMPGINGQTLADRLQPTRSQMKVLYMSGYIEDVVAYRGVLSEGKAFLQKPFACHTLATMVREVIDV